MRYRTHSVRDIIKLYTEDVTDPYRVLLLKALDRLRNAETPEERRRIADQTVTIAQDWADATAKTALESWSTFQEARSALFNRLDDQWPDYKTPIDLDDEEDDDQTPAA